MINMLRKKLNKSFILATVLIFFGCIYTAANANAGVYLKGSISAGRGTSYYNENKKNTQNNDNKIINSNIININKTNHTTK